ncbi:hypothetical protein QVD99_004002 [Batrachochytrium dendrobatidis]|nr:hypothetical protein O5D80_002279 [Batrachochytrium dendrobatidis]KAK5669612.1 hypothetical protein QVD99_004002 [Batrachochytrium dendrobatidis]
MSSSANSKNPSLIPAHYRAVHSNETPYFKNTAVQTNRIVGGLLLAGAAIVCAWSVLFLFPASISNDSPNADSPIYGITLDAFNQGIQKCNDIRSDILASLPTSSARPHPHPRSRNPRIDLAGKDAPVHVLISNATLWNGDGSVQANTDILLKDGLVAQVGTVGSLSILNLNNVNTIHANGRFVTPGLVDMHSHMGLDSWPELKAHSDTNEDSTTRITPQLRSLDGFNPWDTAIKIINSGGVTTSLVLPGSRNLMGGEAFAFKHHMSAKNSSADMLLNAGMSKADGKKWRWMKMACGENPKNLDSSAADGPIYPTTRMGSAYLFRQAFADATQLVHDQDDWCSRAQVAQDQLGPFKAHRSINSRFPSSLHLESLSALLRGNVILNVHCYETYDLEMMVRLSHEFNFKISAFHHALEAWQVADLLAKENIAAAIFADHWGYKQEAYSTSVHAAQILSKKGVKVAFKSDHPVLNAQHLIFEAAKAHHYGLSDTLALQAVTSIPAKLIGQEHRIGHIYPGYDADVVLWDRNPLDIGAHPLKVFVDGYETFKHANYIETMDTPVERTDALPIQGSKSPKPWTCNVPIGVNTTYTLQNYSHALLSPSSPPSQENDSIVIENGSITCIGHCVAKGSLVNLNKFWISPGLIAAGVHLGLEEISAEPLTSSGSLEKSDTISIQSPKRALQIGRKWSKELDAAFMAGVTTSISEFRYDGIAGSDSVVFRTGGTDPVDDILKTDYDVYNFAIGRQTISSKGLQSSIAGHLLAVENFKHSNHSSKSVAIKVRDAHTIRRLVSMIDDKDILVGAVEAWVHADKLSGKNVIFAPARCTPSSWFTRQCLEPSRTPSAYSILKANNVNVGLSVSEDNFVRGLIWEAGWAVSDRNANLTDFEFAQESVGLVSWNIARMYGFLDRVVLRVGGKAHFVIFDDVPGTFKAHVRAVVDQELIECNPNQT